LENFAALKIKYYIFDDFGKQEPAEGLARRLNVGFSYLFSDKLTLSADVKNLLEDQIQTVDGDYKVKRTYHFGCEYRIHPNLPLRLGLIRQNYPRDFDSRWERLGESGEFRRRFVYQVNHVLSLGVGFKGKRFSFDFATAIDNRKKEIEETQVEFGSLKVKGVPLQYVLSISYEF